MVRRKTRADRWTHFTFYVKENKTLCKPHEATFTGKNTTDFYTLYFSEINLRFSHQ